MAMELEPGIRNADDTAIDPQTEKAEGQAAEINASARMPAAARCLHPRLHDDSEKTELCHEESRQGSSHKRIRGDLLHSRRGAQSAGAFGCSHSGRSRQGPSRRPLSYPAGSAGHRGCRQPSPAPFEIRRPKAEIGGADVTTATRREARNSSRREIWR